MAQNKKTTSKKFVFDKNAFMLIMLFIISCLPIALSVTRIGREETRQFSIYNDRWDGTSMLRTTLESQGYTFTPIVSTLNTLTRVDQMGTLAVIGPSIFFDPSETAALAYFIMRGGSVLIADDFGSSNDILSLITTIIQPFISGIDTFGVPVLGFKINNSLLMDSQSFHLSPVMPVIRNFVSVSGSPSLSGIDQVVTSFPSSVSFYALNNETGEKHWVPAFTYEGVYIPSGIAVSTDKSWLEKDVDEARNGEFAPDEDEWGGVPFTVVLPLPLATMGIGNIIICSDPSIFINELMEMSRYDNSAFATSLFNWLDVNGTGRIYYDESHLSTAEGQLILSTFDPFTYIRTYLRFIDSFTMFPLLAPLFPIIAFIFLVARFPRTAKPSPLLMTKIKQSRSRSFFASKMGWYINYQEFGAALHLIYNRLKRILKKKTNATVELNPKNVTALLTEKFPEEFNEKELLSLLGRIDDVSRYKKKIAEEEFTDLVMVIKSIEEVITRPRTY